VNETLGAPAAGATGAFGALGDEGAMGDGMYFLQQRGKMSRPRWIKRRQIFLPSLVLQKSADDGIMLQAISTIKAKSIREERVEFMVLLLLQIRCVGLENVRGEPK
jgi:hypothetical protein